MLLQLIFLWLIIPLMIIIIFIPKKAQNNKNPPGPTGLPLVGNMFQFDKSKAQIYLWSLSKKYGPLVFLKHGTTPVLVVSSSEMAKEVLKTHDLSFCSRPPVVGQQRLSYGGVDMAFSPYNHHWREFRRICVQHVFSPTPVLSFRHIREDETSRMMARVSMLASSSQPIDMSRIAMSHAVNLICRVAFGRRYEEDEHDKIRFDRLVLEAQNLMVSFYYADHFPGWLSWMDIVRGVSGRLKRNCEKLDAFYQQIIEEHLNKVTSNDPKLHHQDGEDIVDVMIGLMKKGPNSSSLDLSWDHVKALLMNLFIAGTDTVAAGVVWTMTGLMLWPAIMNKLQKHIRGVMGKKGTIIEDDLKNLPYLKAVVLESLRLYPPAPLLFRTQIFQVECTIGGYKISPETSVIINGWAIARDPKTWSNPEEFRPERFLDDNNEVINYKASKVVAAFEMLPFGGGRRGCPGMDMGLVSIELALANLLYSFDWALPPPSGKKGQLQRGIDTDACPGLTMHKKTPLFLMATKYDR